MRPLTTPPDPPDNSSVGELIASTPAVLGFHPHESIVVLTAGGDAYTHFAMRADLPLPGEWPTLPRELAEQLAFVAAANGARSAHVWIVSARDVADHTEVIAVLQDVLGRRGIVVPHIAWVPAIAAGAAWSCYLHDDCAGRLPDPQTVPAAAAAAHAGMPTYANRDEIKQLLAPEPDDRVADVTTKLADAASRPHDQQQGWQLIVDTVAAAHASPNLPELDSETIAALIQALQNETLRDAYQLHTLESRAGERLMTALTRATPSPERAIPAALLATHQYLAGDGARAQIAIGIALDADPDNALALLLVRCFNAGMPPHEIREAICAAATD